MIELDVSSWPLIGEEQRGLRVKSWVQSPDGNLWLRKQHRKSRRYEPAVEVFALQLARRAGLDAAEAILATWTSPDGQRARGVCVKNFLLKNEVLRAGEELLLSTSPSYRLDHKNDHKLDLCLTTLAALEDAYGCELARAFIATLVFDAWVGNSDRHQVNWSLIKYGSKLRYSPMYDPAGCLGAELMEDHCVLAAGTDLAPYANRCGSGFGQPTAYGEKFVPMRQVQVVAELRRRAIFPEQLLVVFENCMSIVPDLLHQFADGDLPMKRKDFCLAMLMLRLQQLLGAK